MHRAKPQQPHFIRAWLTGNSYHTIYSLKSVKARMAIASTSLIRDVVVKYICNRSIPFQEIR